jgi:hypothetical protein
MTYKDPNEPVGAESPTEAYRVPQAETPPPVQPPAKPPMWTPPPVQPAASYENGVTTPAPTSPAVAPAASGGRPGRVRWAIAAAVVALVVVVSGVAAALLVGRAPNAKVLAWVPTDSIVYGEIRLDLPGDQRQNLAEFLSHFPGFDDQAAIDTKLDEAFDQFVQSATKGDQSYTADIEPWFDGEVAIAASKLPNPGATANPESLDTGSAAMLLSIKDKELAQAWFDGAAAESGATTEDYDGVTITVVPQPEGSNDGPVGYAVTDEIVVLGELGAVKEVLDTDGASAIAQDPEFSAALNSGNGDHVGFFYYDTAAYFDWAMSLSAESEMSSLGFSDAIRDSLPPWAALWVRVEGDALSFQAVSAPPAERAGPTENRASTLAAHVPATAVVYGETHDYGKALTDMLAKYEGMEIPEETTQGLDQVVGMFGGMEGLVGWIGDVAVVVNDPGEGFEGGVLIQPTDATKAENLFITIRSLLTMGGAGLGFTLTDEQHGDVTITTVDFGELRQLLAQGGEQVDPEVLEYFGGEGAHVQLSWAVTDEVVVIGIGPEFVKHVLDTDAATSLAENDRFTSLIDRTGKENTAQWFADIGAIRAVFEEKLAERDGPLAHYQGEVKPFLEPFDVMAGSSVFGGSNPDTATSLITVK